MTNETISANRAKGDCVYYKSQINRLYSEIEKWNDLSNTQANEIAAYEKEITRLRQRVAELEGLIDEKYIARKELRKDAERYRWAISKKPRAVAAIAWGHGGIDHEHPSEAIDAAMADPGDDFTRGEHDI